MSAMRSPQPDDEADGYQNDLARLAKGLDAPDFDEFSAPSQALPISDFVAFSPDHTYIYRPTGEDWTSMAVNARVMPVPIGGGKKALPANVWLDRNDAVEQRIWAPGDPQIIENRLVAEGGFFAKQGARVFNVYKPPLIIPSDEPRHPVLARPSACAVAR